MEIDIINSQKVKRLNVKTLTGYLIEAGKILGVKQDKLSFYLCDNEFIRKLNRRFFHKNAFTDVIAFPLEDTFTPGYLGEVVVSVEKAVSYADKNNKSWKDELMLYLVHGILHVLGYKDKTAKQRRKMCEKQEEVRDKLKTKLALTSFRF